MSATKERRTLSEAERLDRRERRVLKRIAGYESTMPYPRRGFFIEALERAITVLERVAPDGKRPTILNFIPGEAGYEETRQAVVAYDKARMEIGDYRMRLDAENAWIARREEADDAAS